MFLSRKKVDAAVAETATQISRTAGEFREKINAAEKLADAGERYLALAEIEEKVQGYESATIGNLYNPKDESKEVDYGFSAMLAIGTTGIIGAGLIAGGIPIAVGALFISISSLPVAVNSWEYVSGSRHTNGIKEAFEGAFGGFSKELAEKKEAIIRNEFSGLAASKHFDVLYDKFPAVKEAFIKASAREAVLQPQPVLRKLDKPSQPKQ